MSDAEARFTDDPCGSQSGNNTNACGNERRQRLFYGRAMQWPEQEESLLTSGTTPTPSAGAETNDAEACFMDKLCDRQSRNNDCA